MTRRSSPPKKSRKSTGKPRIKVRSQRKKWTPGEIRRLRQLYPRHSNHTIARKLGRSLSSVVAQAFSLQLKKTSRRLAAMGRENIARRWGARRKSGKK